MWERRLYNGGRMRRVAGPSGRVVMQESLFVSTEAKEQIRDLIGGDDKGRRHIRIFIQGWG
jgi:hypothetical protein